jgi:hypothetical protein
MTRRRRNRTSPAPRDEAADVAEARALLVRLSALLRRLDHARAPEAETLARQLDADPPTAWRRLDGNDWWAGAGSLAADSLLEPTALPAAERVDAQREYRALLIDLAELLRARGPTNPGLSSWLLAFRNWEASGV